MPFPDLESWFDGDLESQRIWTSHEGGEARGGGRRPEAERIQGTRPSPAPSEPKGERDNVVSASGAVSRWRSRITAYLDFSRIR